MFFLSLLKARFSEHFRPEYKIFILIIRLLPQPCRIRFSLIQPDPVNSHAYG